MSQLVILVGPPATGKSTYARKNASANQVIVSRDSIRESLNKKDITNLSFEEEQYVSQTEYDLIFEILKRGQSVIADISNVSYQGQFDDIPEKISQHTVKLLVKRFTCPYWLACVRDFWRGLKGGHRIGPKRIKELFNQYDKECLWK